MLVSACFAKAMGFGWSLETRAVALVVLDLRWLGSQLPRWN